MNEAKTGTEVVRLGCLRFQNSLLRRRIKTQEYEGVLFTALGPKANVQKHTSVDGETKQKTRQEKQDTRITTR